MPYFDNLTYMIGGAAGNADKLIAIIRNYVIPNGETEEKCTGLQRLYCKQKEICASCLVFRKCPASGTYRPRLPKLWSATFLAVANECIAQKRATELLMIADFASPYRINFIRAFKKALEQAETAEDYKRAMLIAVELLQLELIELSEGASTGQKGCAVRTTGILYEALDRWEEAHGHDGALDCVKVALIDGEIQTLKKRRERFAWEREHREEIIAQHQKEEAAIRAQRERERKRAEKERAEIEARKAARLAKRQAEHEKRLARQKAFGVVWHKEHDRLEALPWEERILSICADVIRNPSYYGYDYRTVTKETVATFSPDTLRKILSSHRYYGEKGWMQLRAKAEERLKALENRGEM